MRAYDLLEKKKNGQELNSAQIRYMIEGFMNGEIPDYQMSAFLMAICINGMSEQETLDMTELMRSSGEEIDLSGIDAVTVDKHSTGGVGDKTTLILAPALAALGGRVAKMSGRGLGHTGGTVDKLESIPGFRTELSPEEFTAQVNRIGLCVVSQSAQLAPADKKIYALRDLTATVESIPLIASSIMSKKLAAGSKAIVLDKTTPRLIQFHTLKNAANPPFLGGFSIFGTVAAEAEQRSCQGDSLFSMILCNDRKAIVTE